MPRKEVTPPVQKQIDYSEEPMTPSELLSKLKVPFNPKKPNAKIYELTRRRGNRPPMPSHRVGKLLRFYWSEVRLWLAEVQARCPVISVRFVNVNLSPRQREHLSRKQARTREREPRLGLHKLPSPKDMSLRRGA